MEIILDGKVAAGKILRGIKVEVDALEFTPRLAVVLVGNNPASEVYVKNKLIRAGEIGIDAQVLRLPADSALQSILNSIRSLNSDPSVNGIIVQAPLPDESMQHVVFNYVSVGKDVDGFTDSSVAGLVKGLDGGFIPCTPLGICALLEEYGITVDGKHVVVIGRGSIVGRPLSILLSRKSEKFNATVTLCHSGTKNLETISKLADIIVVAVGKKFFLKRRMLSPGVVVVDVGANREPIAGSPGKYALFGDADFDGIADICGAISPVPGGVGPMTVAMLMRNTLIAAKRQMEMRFTKSTW
ncbi:MAG: bifunctional 5,10-methylenetetrahydrofolate dehydrogenase/5,10-methenyltetrahydrofolate cyclohydrolase [Puniceicoccales bacterium]|jgi:methylenetetrahydrofolate dehydrogenase (NADP+)/methenyltetrahydrofolate cyclohydrolase|nr:bifunctional 5,10-methylenetetrahydrofolate dehydrogenase/5,10-methenyltetrahydrofolate cyclohydrolase [Puniceicoccales bacterium]